MAERGATEGDLGRWECLLHQTGLRHYSTVMKSSSLKLVLPLVLLAGSVVAIAIAQQDSDKPLKALLVTGEGYHDYEAQKKIITAGVSERMAIDWTILHHKTADEAKVDLSKADWAAAYDVVVYNICHAKETDKAFIESVVATHEAGKPMVAIHCSMHSYHWNIPAEEGEVRAWNRLLGVYSKDHGPKAAITVTKVAEKADHPAIKDLPDGWKTPEGELYNIQKVYTADVLAIGNNGKVENPVIWTNKSKDARVFATTIGHHNSTMQTPEFLDLITNGIRWAVSDAE